VSRRGTRFPFCLARRDSGPVASTVGYGGKPAAPTGMAFGGGRGGEQDLQRRRWVAGMERDGFDSWMIYVIRFFS